MHVMWWDPYDWDPGDLNDIDERRLGQMPHFGMHAHTTKNARSANDQWR